MILKKFNLIIQLFVFFHAGTTLSHFLGFVRQQCFLWQNNRRADMLRPDVSGINEDGGDNDPIAPCTDAISDHCWVLQLDSWNVASLTDAMLMRRVFSRLFDSGTFVVSSGHVPVDHYKSTAMQTGKYEETQKLLRKRVCSIEIES